eukprot:snap_masked-scaffold_63-processed-gene-0.44-mRNA-1 protein AED:1.00 eAED:1.00 QI:0/-1/0/0/-1/1/1/0/66
MNPRAVGVRTKKGMPSSVIEKIGSYEKVLVENYDKIHSFQERKKTHQKLSDISFSVQTPQLYIEKY